MATRQRERKGQGFDGRVGKRWEKKMVEKWDCRER
jgi:hypothetical protein